MSKFGSHTDSPSGGKQCVLIYCTSTSILIRRFVCVDPRPVCWISTCNDGQLKIISHNRDGTKVEKLQCKKHYS